MTKYNSSDYKEVGGRLFFTSAATYTQQVQMHLDQSTESKVLGRNSLSAQTADGRTIWTPEAMRPSEQQMIQVQQGSSDQPTPGQKQG